MVRIDALRRSLLAIVPVLALSAVACGGGAGDQTAPTSAEQNATTEPSPAPEQQPADDPVNGVAEGSEGEDEGFAAALAQDGTAPADESADEPGDDIASRGDALLSTRGASIAAEVKRQANFLNKSTSYYSHTTYMNESTHTRRTDCSGFVGYALNRVQPTAFAKVPHPNTFKPLASDWYNYLSTRYTSASTQTTPRWRKLTRAMDLKPGDMVVWLQPAGNTSENTGHIMVVNGYPTAGRSDKAEVIVPVIDSTSAPHANDSRGTNMTGVGSGNIGLKTDSLGKPTAYYWRGGLSYSAISTPIALGRLE